MLETSAFDYRGRHPSKLLLKFAKYNDLGKESFGHIANNMNIDLYRTFAPLKQTTAAMAMACIALTAKLLDQEVALLDNNGIFEELIFSQEEVMGMISCLHLRIPHF